MHGEWQGEGLAYCMIIIFGFGLLLLLCAICRVIIIGIKKLWKLLITKRSE